MTEKTLKTAKKDSTARADRAARPLALAMPVRSRRELLRVLDPGLPKPVRRFDETFSAVEVVRKWFFGARRGK